MTSVNNPKVMMMSGVSISLRIGRMMKFMIVSAAVTVTKPRSENSTLKPVTK